MTEYQSLKFSDQWVDSEKFMSQGRTVAKNGRVKTADYKGNQYRLIGKKERSYVVSERVFRATVGVVAVLLSLGAALLLSKSVVKLFTASMKKVRIGVLISKVQEAPVPIDTSPETVAKVRSVIERVIRGEQQEGVTLYTSQLNHRVFSLSSVPGQIFKMQVADARFPNDTEETIHTRYEKIVEARRVCEHYQLNLLKVPDAEIISVDVDGVEHEVLVERKLDLNPSQSVQEERFIHEADSLSETVRQLAVFIARTGFSDVEWRNIPMIDGKPDPFGCRSVGLIDIEESESAEDGLYGTKLHRRGLVGCVTAAQAQLIKKVAKRHRVSTQRFAAALQKRRDELHQAAQLEGFYLAQGVHRSDQTIVVRGEGLHFPDFPEQESELRRLTLSFVAMLNEKIASSDSNQSTRDRRAVCFSGTEQEGLVDRAIISSPTGKVAPFDQTYLGQIVLKLVEIGAIYSSDQAARLRLIQA